MSEFVKFVKFYVLCNIIRVIVMEMSDCVQLQVSGCVSICVLR